MARIVGAAFRGPSQMTRFLEFTVDRALANDAESLKESVLGTEVCGRRPGFDPRIDPIVRVTANRLRTKLEEYYLGPGSDDPVRIGYPPGSYAPVFTARNTGGGEAVAPPPDAPPRRHAMDRPVRRSAVMTLATMIAVAVGVAGYRSWTARPTPPVPPIRIVVHPPEGRPFDRIAAGGPIALSPDGAWVAYSTRPTNYAIADLRVTSLVSHTTEKISNTGPAHTPFWSPDAKHIGYMSGGELRTVSLETHTVHTLCSNVVMGPRSGSWNGQGVIIYAPGNNASLYRVTAKGGGECRPLTDASIQPQTTHAWPHFLPDDEHFLYTVTRADWRESGIYAASLAEPGQAKLILKAHSPAVYVSQSAGGPESGLLLYAENTNLMAVRFNPRTLETAGEPWVVERKVDHYSFSGASDFSASRNGLLALRTGGGTPRRELIWVDRQGTRRPVPAATDGLFRYPDVSPDGKRILVEAIGQSPSDSDIWLIEGDEQKRRLTSENGSDIGPLWAPDGKRFVYWHGGQIWLRDLDSPGNRQALGETRLYATSWSADSRRLAYAREHKDGVRDVCVIDLASSAAPATAAAKPWCPTAGFREALDGRLSPDGNWLAFRHSEAGVLQVQLVSLAAGPGHPPAAVVQVSPPGKPSSSARWRADGRELYVVEQAVLMAYPVTYGPGPDRIHLGSPRRLFSVPYFAAGFGYTAAPDGSRFLFSSPIGGESEPRPGPIQVVMNPFGNWNTGK